MAENAHFCTYFRGTGLAPSEVSEMSKKGFNVKISLCDRQSVRTSLMNIRRKPDYTAISHDEYLDMVFHAIENRLGEDGAGLLMAGYNTRVISMMIHDACVRFRLLNLSPKYTANQVISLMIEKNIQLTDKRAN